MKYQCKITLPNFPVIWLLVIKCHGYLSGLLRDLSLKSEMLGWKTKKKKLHKKISNQECEIESKDYHVNQSDLKTLSDFEITPLSPRSNSTRLKINIMAHTYRYNDTKANK